VASKWRLGCLKAGGALATLLAVAFFGFGGMQIARVVSGPKLPHDHVPATPSGDLAYLRAVVLANERGVTAEQLAGFSRVIDEATPPRTVDELTLIASRALAQLDNAHSTLLSPAMRRLPIRLHWTADALVVVKARPEHAALLGTRILALGGKTPEEMLEAVPHLVGGGTPGWVRFRSEYFYSAPVALAFLGAAVQNDTVEVRTIDPVGLEERRSLQADAEPLPGDPFWDFLHAFPGDTHFATSGWTTLLRPDQDLPLYLEEAEKLFLLRDFPDRGAVYLRMNGAIDDETETVQEFIDSAMILVEKRAPRYVIVDFRYNRGGDYTAVLPLVKGLSRAIPTEGRLYLITGPNTFSAGLLAGSQFARHAADRLTVVGTGAGDRLRFRGEGLQVKLPATGIEVYLATAWDDVAEGCGWFDNCWPPNKFLLRGVGSLSIDLPAANTWASYRSRRDLVLEAVWSDIDRRRRS
jgi:hypothetical protein